MTYGWSILIVAVVLGALSFLGVFNPMTFTPKATAGGCQVVKNSELGISNLEGSCNNQVPQYVAQFNNRSRSYVDIPYSTSINNMASATASVWVKISGGTLILSIAGTGSSAAQIYYSGGDIVIQGAYSTLYINRHPYSSGAFQPTLNQWYNIIVIFSSPPHTSYDSQIGTQCNGLGGTACNDYFNGVISDVQIYNTSLSQNEVTALYDEGIGGAPIDLQNLVGWWPLNGNADDYSGNNNNGVQTNVVFSSSWISSYTAP